MKKLLFLALVPAVFGTIKAGLEALPADVVNAVTAANAEVQDIQKRSCPDAAGDAAKFLLQIKNIAYDVSDDIGKQIEDTLNNVIKQVAPGKTFKGLIVGLVGLRKMTENPTPSQLNILNIAALVADKLHEKVQSLGSKVPKFGQSTFIKLVTFITTVKEMLTSCQIVGNKAAQEQEFAKLIQETSGETFD
ncbi:hypothetical protein M1466_01165 [Candidatus Dependentiae bacterium]|nr:hypothetical protein [Candidatus Dependentiae bacterium]